MRRLTYWLSVLLIFIIPWEDSITVAALGSVARIIGLIVAVFWVGTMLMEGKFRKPHLFHFLALIFFLWNFVSIFWSPDAEGTTQRIKTYSQIFLLMLIFWEVFQKPEYLRAGLQAYILGAYIPIISSISNYSNGNVASPFEGRYSASGVNAVDLALILIMGLPIAMQLFFAARWEKNKTIWKLINLVYIPLAIFSIILTGSRTSLLAIIPFGIYLVVTHQMKFKRKILVFGLLFISIMMLFPFIPKSATARLSTLGASVSEGDIGGRVILWRESLAIFSDSPILGLGSGALARAIGKPAHNTFVSVATETGFIGFILFFTILATTFVQAMNIPNGNSGVWVTVFLIWVIGVLSLSWEFRKLTWLFLSFIVIEGSFTYEQLHIKQAKVEISKKIRRVINVNEPELKTEAG